MALSVINMGGGGGGDGAYPVSIEVATPPTKTSYKPGEQLDLTGMVVKAVFSDGSRQTVTSQCTFVPAEGTTLTKDDISVAITWTWATLGNTYTTSQTIGMQVPYRIRVKTAPTKTSYKANENLDLSGMVVVADYADGTENVITADCTYNPANGTKLTETNSSVAISWTDSDTGDSYNTTQAITVERVLSSITASAPTKNTYKIGEKLDLTGASVTAHFSSGNTADVTSSSTFNPADGTTLNDSGTVTITVSYTDSGVTKTTTIQVTVKPNLEIVTFADGTDEQLAAMLDAHYAGTINIYDHWKVGDERKVNLSAMAKGVVGETHVAQTVTMVLMNEGGKTLTTPINGKTECAFVVGLKNFLANGTSGEWGYMNSSNTNTNGWDGCLRRTWCNDTFKASLPATFRALFKEHQNITADGSGTTTKTSNDYFFLPSEKDVFGTVSYANATAEANNKQFKYYETASNRIKKQGDSGSASNWWERSPSSGNSYGFCIVSYGGTANWSNAGTNSGIAPHGCI